MAGLLQATTSCGETLGMPQRMVLVILFVLIGHERVGPPRRRPGVRAGRPGPHRGPGLAVIGRWALTAGRPTALGGAT